MKQTAVEWLVERLTETPYIDNFWKHVEQAKEMEKEQMKNAFDSMKTTIIQKSKCGQVLISKIEFEQYYNETFRVR